MPSVGRGQSHGGQITTVSAHKLFGRINLWPWRPSVIFSQNFTSETAIALGRAMIERFPIDWAAFGFGDHDLDELVEQMLRMTQSLVVDPGSPRRTGHELRRYLTRWLAPAIMMQPLASAAKDDATL